MHTIRTRLGLKIFLSYLVVILVGVVVLAFSVSLVLPGAFDRHMAGMSGMMGMMNDDHGMDSLFLGFRGGVYDALKLAALAASVAAIALGFLITRQIVAPVRALCKPAAASPLVAITERVKLAGENLNDMDELGQLAQDFNHMAENLERTEALRRQLIGDVSHELRTPLTAIKGSMEGLIDGRALSARRW